MKPQLATPSIKIKHIILLIYLQYLTSINKAAAFQNIYGTDLKPCSSTGMALTGYTRNGYCVSHHICIDLSSTQGGNFCKVTNQPDWCSSNMPCHGIHDGTCPAQKECKIKHWCVCQWAFARYIEKAGGVV